MAQIPLHDGTEHEQLLLISNKHVFLNSEERLDPKGVVIISLNRRKADDTPDFGNIKTFVQVGFGNLFFHPIQISIWRVLMFPLLRIQMLFLSTYTKIS